MNSFHVLNHSPMVVKHISANIAGNCSLTPLLRLPRCSAVHLPLVRVQIRRLGEAFVAKLALKLLFGLHFLFLWMVTSVVPVQLLNAVVVALADPTNEVPRSILKFRRKD